MTLPHEVAALADDAAHWGVATVFGVVYVGMFLGGLPRLKLDRTGVALLGAIAVIPLAGQTVEHAAQAVDLATLVLLFAFMVIAAQLRLGGFYAAVTRAVGQRALPPRALLAALIAVAATLSAVFSNDVVCLAMTPVVIEIFRRRGMDPLPALLGLACAANIGSAATLIGNPQNMLIGSLMKLHFADYLRQAAPPVLAALVVLWGWLAYGPGGRPWGGPGSRPAAGPSRAGPAADATEAPAGTARGRDSDPPPDALQTAKGLVVATALLLVFLFTDWPRELSALVGAAVLLMSRRLRSAQVMGYVDWPLLLLFISLFVVNDAFAATGLPAQAVAWLAAHGVHLAQPGWLLVIAVTLSNLVSNVPAVMLLLPHLKGDAAATLLALASTLAGNLLLVGSIANLIVADLAGREGIAITWRHHARVGVPVSLAALALAYAWI